MSIRKVIMTSTQKYKFEKDIPEAITNFRNEYKTPFTMPTETMKTVKNITVLKKK